MNTEEDDEFKRIEMESGWRKRQIEQSEMCSNYGGFCKKEWVGLTDEEVESYWDWDDFQCGCGKRTLLGMVRNIEAKLKDKNT